MPWPETTIPKFGEWDGNEDLSYSIVFDKVRADKEKFLPAPKNDNKDSSCNQSRDKIPGLKAGNRAPQTSIERIKAPQTSIERITETGGRSSENNNPKSSSRSCHRGINDQDVWNASDTGLSFSPAMPSSGKQPLSMVQAKNSVAQEMVARVNGSQFYAHSDGLHGRAERTPASIRQMPQYPSATKTTRSQGCSETSSMADASEKVIVPKFGGWDVDDKVGEGFTFIFDRVRDEKKSKSANKSPTRFIAPLRPTEDLYKGSQARKAKGSWLSTLCCANGAGE